MQILVIWLFPGKHKNTWKKKLDDEDKYLALKAKMKKKKEEQAFKKQILKRWLWQKWLKPNPLQKRLQQWKKPCVFSQIKGRRKKLCTHVVQGDPMKITSGQNGTTPLLHRKGLACAVEVPSTRGSREGEPPPRRQPP